MRGFSSFGLIAMLMLIGAGPARSAPPANDACDAATMVTSFPFVANVDTTEATQAPGDPFVCHNGGGPTIWYDVSADSAFFLALGAGSATSSTAPRSLTSNASGLFCPGQLHPGAFGIPAVRRIEMSGTSAGDLRDGAPHPVSLLDLVCIQGTGNPAADQVADFPGPQANSAASTIQLIE